MRDLNFGSLNSKYQTVQIELQRYCQILCRISNKLWPLVFTTPSSYTFLLNHIFNNFTDTTNFTPYLGVNTMYLLTYCSEELNFVWSVFGWWENARKRKQKCSFWKGKLVIYPYPMCFLPLSLSLPIIL